MKYRIIRKACDNLYQVEKCTGYHHMDGLPIWQFVPSTMASTLTDCERHLQRIIGHGEPKDEIIKEVEI